MTKVQKYALILWFDLGWFGCVYLAKWALSPWSFIFPLVSWIILFFSKEATVKQMTLLFALAGFGALFDTAIHALDVIQFSNHESIFIPYWLVAMWFLFVSVLPATKELLQTRLWFAGCLGAILGPLSYFSGEAFQVLSFQNRFAILIYAVFWGIYFPVALYLYRKLT
ncbi:MAG: DUF2878 domain-containing protein [Bdellovibrionales bacterium]